MFKLKRTLKSLLLRWRADGQLELVGQGLVILPSELKKLRKRYKNFVLVLELDSAYGSVHKVYLDEKALKAKNLAYRLWQELDRDDLGFDEIFYDYSELESSLPEHRAYQFVFIKKERLKHLLMAFKKSGFAVRQITVCDYPELNLLPWREYARRRKICGLLLRIFLMPLLVLLSLLAVDQALSQKNDAWSHQLALIYQQGLDDQVGHALTLKTFVPAFSLLQSLPQGVIVNEINWSAQACLVKGDFTSMQILGMLNQKLIQLGWLNPGMSVDANNVDGHYLWQFTSMRGADADSKS